MRTSSFVLIFAGLLVSFAKGQAPENEDTADNKTSPAGPAANTDVSKYAGTYRFTYYYNDTGGFVDSTQLPCSKSESFTVKIPDDPSESVIEKKDLSKIKNGRDPIYNTKEGQWTVVELAKANGFDILKMRLHQNDIHEIYACWGLNLVDKKLFINVNPKNLTQCPTSFAYASTICNPKKAIIVGECLSGVCDGEKSRFATKDPSSAHRFSPIYFISLIFFSLSLL